MELLTEEEVKNISGYGSYFFLKPYLKAQLAKCQSLDRPELGREIARKLAFIQGWDFDFMEEGEDKEAIIFWAEEISALFPDIEETNGITRKLFKDFAIEKYKAVEEAKMEERLKVVKEIWELCTPLDLISSSHQGIALTFQDLECLRGSATPQISGLKGEKDE